MSSHALGFGDGFTVNAYTNHPPAIIQKAEVKNCAYYETKLEAITDKCATDYTSTLVEYKQSGAWREKYSTWDAACEIGLERSKRWINKLLEINKKVGTKDPTSEQKNPPKSQQPQPDAKSASSENKNPPKSTTETQSEAAKIVPLDDMGFPIPETLVATRERRDEITKLMSAASSLKCFFDEQQKPDPQFDGAFTGQVQTLMTTMNQVHYKLSQCKPDVVCPSCDGKAKGCHDCRSTGFISSSDWTHKFLKSSASWIQAKVAKRQKAIEL